MSADSLNQRFQQIYFSSTTARRYAKSLTSLTGDLSNIELGGAAATVPATGTVDSTNISDPIPLPVFFLGSADFNIGFPANFYSTTFDAFSFDTSADSRVVDITLSLRNQNFDVILDQTYNPPISFILLYCAIPFEKGEFIYAPEENLVYAPDGEDYVFSQGFEPMSYIPLNRYSVFTPDEDFDL